MESAGKAAIIVALITAIGGIIVALITNGDVPQSPQTNRSIEIVTPVACPTIPPTTASIQTPREGFVWIPGEWSWSNDKFEWKSGHWERPRAGGNPPYIPGHWDTSSGSCVWIRGAYQK